MPSFPTRLGRQLCVSAIQHCDVRLVMKAGQLAMRRSDSDRDERGFGLARWLY